MVSAAAQLSNGIAVYSAPGTGDRVLWIHGYTLNAQIWQPLWAALPGWSHLGVDLPGHGASAPMRPGEDLGQLARCLVVLAQAHQVRHLVGLSFGGEIALQMAIEAPTAFATLTLGSPGWGSGPQDPAAHTRNVELTHLYAERGPGPWLTDLWMQSPPDIFKGAAQHPALWQALHAIVNEHPWDELRGTAMQYLVNYPQPEKDLRPIQAATLLMIGEEDMTVFKRIAEMIRRAIPGAQRIYLPAAGHLGLLEVPETVYPIIATHLRTHALQVPAEPSTVPAAS